MSGQLAFQLTRVLKQVADSGLIYHLSLLAAAGFARYSLYEHRRSRPARRIS